MEGGMQPTGEEYQGEEAPAEGPRRLELVEHMRMLADAHTKATRGFLLRGADEIERLSKIIDDYARISAASHRELAVLREAVAKNRIVVVGPGQAGTDE